MATIKKIADMAGVSVATVSYVMNNRPDVSADTRMRVLEIAKKINYVPSRISRNRREESRKIKSLAFVSCLPFDPWGEPYFGQFLTGCLNASHKAGAVLQVARVDVEPSSKGDIPMAVRERIADGLIVTGWPSRGLIESLAARNIPMVLVDAKEAFDGYHHVRPDHAGGTAKAIKFLNDLGHTRIGVITGDMDFTCETERLWAYYMAMSRLNLNWKDEWIVKQPLFNDRGGYDGMEEFLQRKLDCTAVVCHGDMIARGAMKRSREQGLRVPDDLSIIGCDNQAWSEEANPPLSTIDVSLVELGQVAARHLLALIEHPKLSPQRITLETRIVARSSTGPAK